MKILVTGGAGFIGSHLAEALVKRGDSVVALDDLSTGNKANLNSLQGHSNFKFVSGSILDVKLTESLIEGVDGVFHFAAAVGVKKILDDPIGSMRTNLLGSEIVLGAAAGKNKPTILASTSEIYGKNPEVPLTEESVRVLGSPLLSRWTYSEAKALDESLARSLHLKNNWNIKIVRLFNTVGPRQSAAYGMVIPRFVEAALKNKPLTVYGDGRQQRVFCHIEDAIAGILALWDAKSGSGEAFNLGGLEEISIVDLAERVIKETGSSSKIEFVPYSKLTPGFDDIARRVPDSSKLSKLTGWKAKSDLEKILKDTVKEVKSRS
ncbi:MAG: GDP-mannose 4,6-dehydratase [Candidatus Nanopelagicaceae bacterium]